MHSLEHTNETQVLKDHLKQEVGEGCDNDRGEHEPVPERNREPYQRHTSPQIALRLLR